jgi:hypothetical protein
MDIQNAFYRLMHVVIREKREIALCLGLANVTGTRFDFGCECHDTATPILVRDANDWKRQIDPLSFWPRHAQDTESLSSAVDAASVCEFDCGAEAFKYVARFEPQFIRDILGQSTGRAAILYAVAKRLLRSRAEAAGDEGLKDEPVRGKPGVRRFRVTGSSRIHYRLVGDQLTFARYYSEGQHDVGLRP